MPPSNQHSITLPVETPSLARSLANLQDVCDSSSSSNSEQQGAYRPPYSEVRGHMEGEVEEEEEGYRRQLAEQTKRGYYNPQKYKDTEL